MLDFALEALGLLWQMPSNWRTMNGGAVVFGAIVYSVFGLLFTAFGVSAFWGENSGAMIALKLLSLAIGLAILVQVVAGVCAAVRANHGRT